jgi:anti-sigma regulatory factor (Ser/Thr protein kinase)
MERQMLTSRHAVRFPGTFAGLEVAGSTLRQLLDERQLAGAPRYNVELAFEEIGANIVRHGSPTSDVEVAIVFTPDETVLQFEDDGVPFDPREHTEPTLPQSLDDALVGGLGIMLVRKVSTRVHYERTPQQRNQLTVAISAR